jgi:protein tyrosine/serine phosphatase
LAQDQHITINNFRRVNSWLFRGGQPQADEFEQLAKIGIVTIISFRWNGKVIAQERQKAQEYNFNLFSIPLSYWVLPTRKEIERFFTIIDDASKRPIFVHCLHGSDRTGMFVAIYRMAREGWTADAAYTEMKEAGFHRFRMHQFKWAVYGFARRLEREQRTRILANQQEESQDIKINLQKDAG